MKTFSLSSIFSDHSVLQRNEVISVFGYVNSNCKITVTLYNKDKKILCKNSVPFVTEKEIK